MGSEKDTETQRLLTVEACSVRFLSYLAHQVMLIFDQHVLRLKLGFLLCFILGKAKLEVSKLEVPLIKGEQKQ